jgi:hypothetical protein
VRALLLSLLLLTLTACSGAGADRLGPLTYGLTGGIAGFDQRLAVAPDGSFQLFDRAQVVRSGRLTGDEMARLRTLAARVPWPEMKSDYVDPRVADALFETITVQVGTVSYTTVVGTGGEPPAALSDLARYLRQLLEARRRG